MGQQHHVIIRAFFCDLQVCNHKSECQCESGWLPPNCDLEDGDFSSLSTCEILLQLCTSKYGLKKMCVAAHFIVTSAYKHNWHLLRFRRGNYWHRYTGGFRNHCCCVWVHLEKTTASQVANVSHHHLAANWPLQAVRQPIKSLFV